MSEIKKAAREKIINSLTEKACAKQKLYKSTQEYFEIFKKCLIEMKDFMSDQMKDVDADVKIGYDDKGRFEAHLRFSGDLLVFTMHTNVFNFSDDHFIFNTDYVKEDPSRSYCGMIQIYNFLNDSLVYNRIHDLGYLIGRVFINKEDHFFVEGKRQLGFLYNDFENMILTEDYIKAIIESAVLYSIDFDLLVPHYTNVKEITVAQKIQELGISNIVTGKRLGFRFQADMEG